MARYLRTLGFAPVSLALLVLLWVLRETIGPDQVDLLGVLGESTPPSFADIHLYVSGWTSATRAGAILWSIGILVFAVPAERVLGSVRFAAAVVLSHLIAVPAGLLIARGAEEVDLNRWGNDLLHDTYLSPVAWIFGTAAVASAAMPVLWRRRVRLLLLAISVTLMLYTGTLADVVAVTAVALGWMAGEAISAMRARKITRDFDRANEESGDSGDSGASSDPADPAESGSADSADPAVPADSAVPTAVSEPLTARRAGRLRAWLPASVREARILVAGLVGAVAAGPVLAGLNPNAEGPFSPLTKLIWQLAIDEEMAYAVCEENPVGAACMDAIEALQQTGVGPLLANLIPLIITIVIAFGLSRGRRAAWWLAVTVQVITIGVIVAQLRLRIAADGEDLPFDFLTVLNVFAIVLPWLAALAALLLTRRLFRVRIDATRVRSAAVAVVGAWFATAGTWLVGAITAANAFQPPTTWSNALLELPNRFLPPALASLYPTHLYPRTTLGWALYEWVGTVFWLIAALVLFQLLMSVPDPSREADRARAEELLRGGTGDHLSWMTLWNGNRYWFAPDDAGYVAYRVHGGVALTVGEPVVGGNGDVSAVADGFEAHAMANAWRPTWYSVGAEFADSRAAHGFRRIHVAEEAVLDTANVAFKGKKFQNIRTARNHAGKQGIRAVWTTWDDLDLDMRNKVLALSEEWVAEKALPEMGFTLGTVAELSVPGTRLLLAVDEGERLHGVTSWLPVYRDGAVAGYTLDFMRRDSEGFRPVIEFLLAEALQIGADAGYGWMSLSGAPLATPGDAAEPGFLDAALDKVGETMEPLYGFRSLAASKNKFRPDHRGWYLCYPDELNLPAIGLAVSTAYLPHLKPSDAVAAMKVWAEARAEERAREAERARKAAEAEEARKAAEAAAAAEETPR